MGNNILQNQSVEGNIEGGIDGNSSGFAVEENRASDIPRAELVESLSAMMDDEAESLEIRRVVKSLEHGPELLAHWRRFHVVRASLQHELDQEPTVDLLAAVKARLAEEAAAGRLSNTFHQNLLGRMKQGIMGGKLMRVAGQGLIAASVAAAILVGYPMLNVAQKGAGSNTQALVADRQAPVRDTLPQMNGDYSASPLTRTVSLDDAARHRLENAVRNFSGTAAVLNSNNSRMFVNQLEPFAPPSPAIEQSAQHR